MMYPAIFPIIAANKDVTDLIGTDPVRFFPFDEAPQNVKTPYVVHQLAGGVPYNTLRIPSVDRFSLQIDVYAKDQAEALAIAEAVIYAIQDYSYITGYNLNEREEETKLWRYSFNADWSVYRKNNPTQD